MQHDAGPAACLPCRRFTVRATSEKSSIPIFECLLGYNLLQVLRLAPEISRCGPRRVAGEPALPASRNSFKNAFENYERVADETELAPPKASHSRTVSSSYWR